MSGHATLRFRGKAYEQAFGWIFVGEWWIDTDEGDDNEHEPFELGPFESRAACLDGARAAQAAMCDRMAQLLPGRSWSVDLAKPEGDA